MSNENYNAFFSPDVEANEVTAKSAIQEFTPSAAKGKNNIYQAIIRFVPWWENPKHGSIQEKWVSYLTDPVTNRGKYVDCPSSIGKPSPLQDIYWKLKKSESVQEQKLAQTFSRRHSYSSLIQVIKDDNNPELEGKLVIWRYGVKIYDKLNAELKPVIGDKHDPFDIMTGKAFAVVVTKVSGFNNYDQSKFVDKRIPLCIPNAEGKLEPITEQTDKQGVFNWVKENSADLGKYAYREWDQETFDYVNHIITSVTGQGTQSAKYANIVNKTAAAPANEGITSTNIQMGEINLESEDLKLPSTDLPNLDFGSDTGTGNNSGISGISGNLDDILGTT